MKSARIRPALLVTSMALGLLCWASFGFAAAESVDQLFHRAGSDLQTALSTREKDRKVEMLKSCIERFQQVLRLDPTGRYGDRCTYLIAQCHHRIHDSTHSSADLQAAREHYKTVVRKYPASPLADDAQFLLGVLSMADDPALAYTEFSRVVSQFPKGDMQPRACRMMAELEKRIEKPTGGRKPGAAKGKESSEAGGGPSGCAPMRASKEHEGAIPGGKSNEKASSIDPRSSSLNISSCPPGASSGPASSPDPTEAQPSRRGPGPASSKGTAAVNQLKRIQHWSGPDFTRVVLYLSDPVAFKEQATQTDPKAQQPARICLDLKNCVLSSRVSQHIQVKGSFLREVHSSQVDATQARVVLDTQPADSYRIFSMASPFRLIVDVRGRKSKIEPSIPPAISDAPASSGPSPPSVKPGKLPASAPSLARQLGLGVRRIVIDPGHGGNDKGASSRNGLHEKDLTLAIARELKTLLEQETGCEVILTRTRDRYLSLEERTAIANTQKADLFISIHVNAHPNRSLQGVETYFLNLSKDKESARVAALENATSSKKISDLEAILQDLMFSTKLNESSLLAAEVQNQVIRNLRSQYDGIRDLGTKQAPFYVLLGAEMPSILIETAFLTNEQEERRLKDAKFRENLAKAISSGIGSYIRQMKGFAKAGGPP